MSNSRIAVTPAAAAVIQQLKDSYGELFFHQSGGCCEGSYPHCFEKGGFLIGSNDVKIGQIESCDFYMAADQFAYWQHTHLTLDVMPGRAAGFSLESTLDMAFIIHSRLFTEAELQDLEPIINSG
ncbi:DUF779 domain-containing protein [Pedobacter antarcticus]|uniref:UDP-glucose 4-epimerase n=2 Tax=Pedobacter antarcticus TaxID=34086 RepID=A0A081PD44_9SPHI|nr:DUF779 domain-containing protein [Pedobacter antarcticus]KEQ28617.1 UDP-glucose 4-epimerase [Pedobacter antarcticus 4BY]SDL71523.1 hypothetical protein SAMN04488084_102214 [Pedobacter antarcticus]SFE86869.1 hypothetical protein SAMN03003324_01593 [Pedobacter antarcticus]